MMMELPAEIWGKVFEIVVQQDDTVSARIGLLQVSSSWRSVATATPQLWTNLQIHNNKVSQAEFYLHHSGALPLDIHLDLVAYTDAHALTKVLSSQLSRIRLLDIHVQQHEHAEEVIAQIGAGKDASILESIRLRIPNSPNEILDGFEALQSAFRSTPNLLQLDLPAYPLPNPESPLFAIPSLTHLTLDATLFFANLNPNMIFEVIGAVSGHLQSFTFHGSDDFSYADSTDFPTFDLPHLTEVIVSAPGWGLDILDTFKAPALTKVRLDARKQKEYHETEEWTTEYSEPVSISLRRLSERSPQMKQLELFGTALHHPEDDYPWLFSAAFPMIEVLRFVNTDITDDLLRSATVENMPRLKTLELRECENIQGKGLLKNFV